MPTIAVFEMGRVEHVTEDKTHEEFIDFVMFLHFDTCKHVYLKEVRKIMIGIGRLL